MTLDEANKQIALCAKEMNEQYGQVVFDEWAVVSLQQPIAHILAYTGPRNDAFLDNFSDNLGALRTAVKNARYHAGDFEFARHGNGADFEALIVLGEGVYLICNNTRASMDDITRDPRWLKAQVPFAGLADTVRSSPLTAIPQPVA